VAFGDKNFFGKQTAASKVKSEIVLNHFDSWSNIVIGQAAKLGQNIAYMDLYCGPGIYDNGAKSTPLLVLDKAMEKAGKNPAIAKHLVTIFNDKKKKSVKILEGEVAKMSGLSVLKNPVIILNEKVDKKTEAYFSKIKIPTLTFLDPFGYMGLTRGLIEAVVTKTWGCDCIFFFSYSSINRALSAKGFFTEHMEALFGKDRAAKLEAKMQAIKGSDRGKPQEREAIILDALTDALEELNKSQMFVRTFRFKKGKRTSHMLVFVTTHPKGFRVMTDIMANAGHVNDRDFPHFTDYSNPPSKSQLFYPEIDELKKDLCVRYAGKKMTMLDIFLDHRQYTAGNYKDILNELEEEKRVTVDPPANKRRMGVNGRRTFKDEALVTFPARKK
jgi:three-Cys-motif partner protein